jgi:outer membrane lipoprotein-sorting protein
MTDQRTRASGVIILCLAAAAASAQTSKPANIDDALWQRLLDTNARSQRLQDLTATFEQQKFTPLLKKPLTSRGQIRVRGQAMVWDTRSPEPTIMAIDESLIRLYYPKQSIVEEYPVDKRLGSLAASPLPRLDVLTRYFTFAQIPATEAFKNVDPSNKLALRLTPIDDALREHLREVRVLLDTTQGFILQAEMVDADGDRTRITFSDIKANTGLTDADVRLPPLPPSVKITRPLEGLGGGSGTDRKGPKQ